VNQNPKSEIPVDFVAAAAVTDQSFGQKDVSHDLHARQHHFGSELGQGLAGCPAESAPALGQHSLALARSAVRPHQHAASHDCASCFAERVGWWRYPGCLVALLSPAYADCVWEEPGMGPLEIPLFYALILA
jgi:hypothetical protein